MKINILKIKPKIPVPTQLIIKIIIIIKPMKSNNLVNKYLKKLQ